tara:strand:+ start:2839 stop:3204 length:366 start_codon:yes stop_codon:yes gene_type:complete
MASNISSLLQTSVAVITFPRRRPKEGFSAMRRMVCTNAAALLNSMQGRMVLNYRPTTGAPKYNPGKYSLLLAWDILMQNYRMINLQGINIEREIPIDEFWEYFEKELSPLTTQSKLAFMNA